MVIYDFTIKSNVYTRVKMGINTLKSDEKLRFGYKCCCLIIKND